ncbi:MAG TPA: ABC transporter substrate-binding protein [Thermoanaerobaculia bacterium]|jgi:peptide/nickel transport system substrate-binding protein|nr:ABC transporter substrate-binding protein [Thermoanaerobaculia bacterium]
MKRLSRRRPPALLAAVWLAACARPLPAPDTVAVLADRDVEGLDPHTSGQIWQTQNVLLNAYEPLVGVDAQMSVVPALAASWSSPDDVTWDFRLRPGVSFHTGGTVRAQDVAFSLLRARDHERSALKPTLSGVADITVLAPDLVRIRTSEPDPLLATKLREVFILSAAFVERHGEASLEEVSCGTGPFRIVSRERGAVVELRRFDGYWKGLPSISHLLFVARTFGDPALEKVVPKEARLVFWVPPGSALFESCRRSYDLHVTPSLSVTYLAFDLERDTPAGVTLPPGAKGNPFRDPDVREAMARTIDPEAFLAADAGTAASQFVPPGVFGFDPTLPPLKPDREEARRHLARSGFPRGFDVDLDVRKMQDRYAAPIARGLLSVGITARVNALPEAEFFAKLAERRSASYVLRFSCRSGDAQEFLDAWLHSHDEARGLGRSNFSFLKCPVAGLDAAIDAARHESTPLLRNEMLKRIMRSAVAARLAVPLFFNADVTFVSRDLDWKPRADTFRTFGDAKIRR